MNFLLFLCVIAALFTVTMGFLGHNIKIMLPIVIAITILVVIIRALIIKWKNTY